MHLSLGLISSISYTQLLLGLALIVYLIVTAIKRVIWRHVTYKANSALHLSGVSKWVPALAGKAKAGMVHSISGCTRGVRVKLWEPLRTCAILEHVRVVFTTRCYTVPHLPFILQWESMQAWSLAYEAHSPIICRPPLSAIMCFQWLVVASGTVFCMTSLRLQCSQYSVIIWNLSYSSHLFLS